MPGPGWVQKQQQHPRRLALAVQGIPLRQPDLKEEKKGPRVGAPDQAIQGFLKSAGLKAISADNGTAFRIVRRLTKREPGFSVSSPGGRSAGRPERSRTGTPATTRR